MISEFDTPVLRYTNKRRLFKIMNDSGTVLAETVPVVGGPGKGRLARRFSAAPYLGPIVLQASAPPIGTPLFTLERPGDVAPVAQPVLVRAPDNSPLGTILEDDPIPQEDHLGKKREAACHRILDSRRQLLGKAIWETTYAHHMYKSPPKYCDFFNPTGMHIGHYEKMTLRFEQPTAGILRLLLAASPVLHSHFGG